MIGSVKVLEAKFPITLELLHDFTAMMAIEAGCEYELYAEPAEAFTEYERVRDLRTTYYGRLLSDWIQTTKETA